MQLRYYPDPCLRESALLVETVNEDVRENVRGMIEIMHAHRGIGLAGNQVGWMRRVIVVASTEGGETKAGSEVVLINPKVIQAAGVQASEEGCLSVPGIYGTVQRSAHVVVEALDLEGRPLTVEGTALKASVLQHEIDHLNGILFITKLSPADRQSAKKQLRELEERFRAAHA